MSCSKKPNGIPWVKMICVPSNANGAVAIKMSGVQPASALTDVASARRRRQHMRM